MDAEPQIKALVETLAPRTAHQYKLYQSKYIEWCRSHGLVRSPPASGPYADVIVTASLVHWFVLAHYVCAADAQFSASALRKLVSALKFLHRLCRVYDPAYPYRLDGDYLEAVVRLHIAATAENPPVSPLRTVSVNMWNPHTSALSEKYFRGGVEKLRFLVDFHLQQFWRLRFQDRSRLKLGDLRTADGMLLYQSATAHDDTLHTRRFAALPQREPWACPLVSLAAYLYLRFYGAHKSYKGDGFPNLLDNDDWSHLPLIRGKSHDKYPREETMSNYYSDVFRYCHLPYKRREYFQLRSTESVQFPATTPDEDQQLQQLGQGAQQRFFPEQIPLDFLRAMNHYPIYETANATLVPAPRTMPQVVLVQVFAEIQEYSRQWDKLDANAQEFLSVMTLLRDSLVAAMPFIYHAFPEHDLFRDPMYQTPEVQSYFQEVIESCRSNGQLAKYEPQTFGLLGAEPDIAPPSQPNPALAIDLVTHSDTDSASLVSYLRDQTFQFVQFQTATNFHLLISLLTQVFERLETKKSNRELIIHQLGSLEQTLKDRIAKTTPQDVKQEESESNTLRQTVTQSTPSALEYQQPSDRGTPDDVSEIDSNDEDDENIRELQVLVSQLLDTKMKDMFEAQTTKMTAHIQSIVQEQIRKQVREEVRTQLAYLLNGHSPTPSPAPQSIPQKREREDDRPPPPPPPPPSPPPPPRPLSPLGSPTPDPGHFTISPELQSIEDVILEWFTPNSQLNGECIHSMNQKHGKKWRLKDSTTKDLYRQRKTIVEFYISLVNERNLGRYEAVALCERLRGERNLEEFSSWLRNWKKTHNQSYNDLH
ncbi:LAFE_0F16336g1_1 [Lachancea fermentati]|uniref:LAFE_0F16336g1_1 n=1 Tax=Lachancea fermentati TaxID=4955 RepID=A0A1G4MGK1_LACFM|nr:LAFE_0F16336g1_1 [Lachancea fermentati]